MDALAYCAATHNTLQERIKNFEEANHEYCKLVRWQDQMTFDLVRCAEFTALEPSYFSATKLYGFAPKSTYHLCNDICQIHT